MARSWTVLAAWVLLLGLVLVGGHLLGGGALAIPAPEVEAWWAWASGTDPLIVVMAVLRVLLLALGWYLLATTVLGVAAQVLRAARLVRFTDAVSVPLVRQVVQRATGTVVATALVTVSTVPTVGVSVAHADPPGAVPSSPSAVTMRGLEEPDASDEPTVEHEPAAEHGEGDSAPEGAASIPPWRLLLPSPADLVPTPDVVEAPSDGVGAVGRDGSAGQMDVTDDTRVRRGGEVAHTVRPGDSLWRIAAQRLETVLGGPPRDAEVVPYWREVIERNRDRLVVPDDPDLLLPGQDLVLPPVAPS
ncbi:MAG: LysM peptidoglycan-binding domain-containing protein [Nitriliruptoraceae bacterium]